jgi:hypothetical protein
VKFRTYIHIPARTDSKNFMKITKKLDEKIIHIPLTLCMSLPPISHTIMR